MTESPARIPTALPRTTSPVPQRSPARVQQRASPGMQQSKVVFSTSPQAQVVPQRQRSASPRGAVPSKELSNDAMADYVSTILNAPPVSSRLPLTASPVKSSPRPSRAVPAYGYSPRPVPVREPSIRTVPATQSRRVTTAPRVMSVNTQDEDMDETSNRRQGPVIVSLDTQIPELAAKMPGRQLDMGKQLKPDVMIVNTPYGEFIIPNYDLMNKRDVAMAMESYRMKFKHINHDWRHTGDTFDLPRPDEDIVRVAVRYQETERYLSAKTGTDFWFVILCAFWGFIEYQACKWDLPAKGYLSSQIGMYKMYQSQLTRMGTVSNVGSEWPPWLQVCVTSAFSMAVLVCLSKFGQAEHAGKVMKEISYMISGNRVSEMSEAGTPKPPEGGMIEMISNMANGGGIGTMMSLFTGMMGGGGDGNKRRKKKRSKKDKEADNKAAEEAADVDI